MVREGDHHHGATGKGGGSVRRNTDNKLLPSRICGSNTAYQRNTSDFYPTPPEATQALLDFLQLSPNTRVWEPASGKGHMVRVLRDNGFEVIGTDILNGVDFLRATLPEGVDWIITNPPFSQSEAFIMRCIESNLPFALLLKSQYWHAKRRIKIFREFPPQYILPLSWRPDFLFGERGGGSPLMDVMWCVWKPGFSAYPRYIVLDRPAKEN